MTKKEEVPLQFQVCKHGTPFRYECEDCTDNQPATLTREEQKEMGERNWERIKGR